MTTLPATVVDAEAQLATRYVRKWLDQCRAEDWLDIGISMVDPKAGHIHLRQILKFLAMSPLDPFKIIEILNWARAGWEDADIAMRELSVELENRGEPVPVALKAYRNELLNPYRQQWPRAHGAQKATHILQDIVITVFVERLIILFPTLPFFSRSPRKTCICGIVAMCFNEAKLGRLLTADGVRKIWKRLGDDPTNFNRLLLEKFFA
jgi:hypothetical protein